MKPQLIIFAVITVPVFPSCKAVNFSHSLCITDGIRTFGSHRLVYKLLRWGKFCQKADKSS
jgi:hypothetical protein